MEFRSIPAVIRSHDDQRTGVDRRRITRAMYGAELRFGNDRVALVSAAERAAVAEKMLHRRQRVSRCHELRRAALTLKAGNHCRGVLGHQLRRLGIALIGWAPSNVAANTPGRA